MSTEERRVRRAMLDARTGETKLIVDPRDHMVWDGDSYVPLDSPLDMTTLDERHAHGMGEPWEERRQE